MVKPVTGQEIYLVFDCDEERNLSTVTFPVTLAVPVPLIIPCLFAVEASIKNPLLFKVPSVIVTVPNTLKVDSKVEVVAGVLIVRLLIAALAFNVPTVPVPVKLKLASFPKGRKEPAPLIVPVKLAVKPDALNL